LIPRTSGFAAWTPPSPDKRPAILVIALLAGLLTALMVPTLRDYFGLTRPAGIVYEIALPFLVIWFLALAAAYRFSVMDRLLGLPDLMGRDAPEPRSMLSPDSSDEHDIKSQAISSR
jgi:cation-transporting ATPase E